MSDNKTADSNGATGAPGMDADGLSRVDVTQVGGVAGMDSVDPKGSDDHHTRLVNQNVMQVGSEVLNEDPPSVDVGGPLKQELGEPTSTWTPGRGDSAGQHDPVTNKGLDMYNSSFNGIQHTALMLTGDPLDGIKSVDVGADLLQEVGPPTSTWGSDDFHITDPVTDISSAEVFNGADPPFGPPATHHPPEMAPVEELQAGQSNPMGDPARHHDSEKDSLEALQGGGTGTRSHTEVRTHILKSMKIAEVEVGLGIAHPDAKFDRAAELEKESAEQLDSRLDSYMRVRKAGLRRPTRQAAAIPAVPSFAPATIHEASSSMDDFDIEAASLYG